MRKRIFICLLLSLLFIFLSACGRADCPPVDEWVISRRESFQRRHALPTYRVTLRANCDCRHNNCVRFIAATEAEFELAFVGETLGQWRERKLERLEQSD